MTYAKQEPSLHELTALIPKQTLPSGGLFGKKTTHHKLLHQKKQKLCSILSASHLRKMQFLFLTLKNLRYVNQKYASSILFLSLPSPTPPYKKFN